MLEAIRISNGQVDVVASTAVWDEINNQLVAITIASPAKQSIESIFASYVTNSVKWFNLKPDKYESIPLKNAKKGGVKLPKTMDQVNAKAYMLTMEHPAAGDPRLTNEPYFYILVLEGEDLMHKFYERLNIALELPVFEDWIEYLYEAGLGVGAVKYLSMKGPRYDGGLCVTKSTDVWSEIISAGVIGGSLKIGA